MATLSDAPTYAIMMLVRASAILTIASVALPALAETPPAEDTRPLSPAQIVVFETPHLQNVDHAETLDYGFMRDGAAGFTDKIALHIRQVNPDGSKSLSFDYLTGDRQVKFPELDHFRGNPLLMLTLERDVAEMKEQVGLSVAYFRNKIREAFVTKATITDATFMLNGAAVPAREVTLRPFEGDGRLDRISSLQAKTYSFVFADKVPGTLAEIRIGTPADVAMAAPAFNQRTTFTGVEP